MFTASRHSGRHVPEEPRPHLPQPLWWAAGVLFFAVTTIGLGSKEQAAVENSTGITDATGAAVSNADLALVANLGGG